MIELLLPCGFDTLEYCWVQATIGICTLANFSVAKKCQQACGRLGLPVLVGGGRGGRGRRGRDGEGLTGA
jgi:hypothetical protein